MRFAPPAFALLIAACASAPEPTPASRDAVRRPGLDAQPLAPGDCALFVWRADAERAFTLFSSADRAVAHIDGDVTLAPSVTPFAPVQVFSSGEADYALDLRDPDPLDGGVRYTSGTLKTVSEDGWDVIVPVIGLSLCQPATSS